MHIFSICLRLYVSSLSKIQDLQIEWSEKGKHTNESMTLKMFYLCGFVWWTKCIWWAIENNYLLVYKLFYFAVELIPVIRNKSLTFLQFLIRKKWMHSVYLWYLLSTSVCCSDEIVSSAWLYFLLESTMTEMKN